MIVTALVGILFGLLSFVLGLLPTFTGPSTTTWKGFFADFGTKLSVVGIDCLDGTPLIDIKPYFASTDAVPDAVTGWHAARNSK